MDGAIIKLKTPVKGISTTYSEIVLREPTGALYSRLGPPRILIHNPTTGSAYWVQQNEAISAYLDALVDGVDSADAPIVFKRLSLVDTLRLHEALFLFFQDAAETAQSLRRDSSLST